jgi:hypothetical protein
MLHFGVCPVNLRRLIGNRVVFEECRPIYVENSPKLFLGSVGSPGNEGLSSTGNMAMELAY